MFSPSLDSSPLLPSEIDVPTLLPTSYLPPRPSLDSLPRHLVFEVLGVEPCESRHVACGEVHDVDVVADTCNRRNLEGRLGQTLRQGRENSIKNIIKVSSPWKSIVQGITENSWQKPDSFVVESTETENSKKSASTSKEVINYRGWSACVRKVRLGWEDWTAVGLG